MMNWYRSIFKYFNILFCCKQFYQWDIDSVTVVQSLIVHTPFFVFYIFIAFVFCYFSVVKLLDILTFYHFNEKYHLPCFMDILIVLCFLIVYIPWDIITFDRYSFFEEINGYITVAQMKEYLKNDIRNLMYNIGEVCTCGLYLRPTKRLERILRTPKFKREYIIRIKVIDENVNMDVNDCVDYSSSTLTTPLLLQHD